MIHSNSIPLTAKKFIGACKDDVAQGRYAPAGDYLEYLIKVTKSTDLPLLSIIRRLDRTTGQPRYLAQADHIIPQSVWHLLMTEVVEPGKGARACDVISNLFWREPDWNEKEDNQSIQIIKSEAAAPSFKPNSSAGKDWRRKWIEIFLKTKHDEGFSPTEPHDPRTFDRMRAADEQSNWLNIDTSEESHR
jgi:hypothetical protein